jgi:hypothetical protein
MNLFPEFHSAIKQDQITDALMSKLMKVLIHTCDISNPSMPFADFKEWGLRICQEFDDLF